MRQPRPDVQELIRSARRIRELIWQDPHRPRYHLTPPEGFFNDPNGALFWNGRYHLFYLAREPIPHPRRPGEEFWVAVWDHVSSRDLVHWIQHPPAVRPKPDGSTPLGIFSGGAIKNAPRPALIYHVPEQGTCIAVAEDDDLIKWRELPQNPVIPLHRESDEYVVLDPAGWYEDGTCHALIGNKNRRPGYEGDCTRPVHLARPDPLGVPGPLLPVAPRVDTGGGGRGLPRLLPDREPAYAPDALPPPLRQHRPLLPGQLPGPPLRSATPRADELD